MELYNHQKEILNLLTEHKGYGVFAEQGTGKTLPMLIHITNLFMAGKIKNCLIVAPLSAMGAWTRDISKLSALRQSYADKITIVNYDKLSRKTSKYREEVTKHWGCIVLDEAHAIKERTSNRTKFLLSLAAYCDYRYILTGTPLTNGRLEDFFTLMNFIYPRTFSSWKEFAARYLIQFQLPGSFVQIVRGYRNQDELLNIVAERSVRVLKKDCLDLPEKLPDEVIYVENKEPKLYKEALELCIEELDIIMANGLVKIAKIRQLLSGHIKNDEGEVVKLKCDKLQVLEELIESIGDKTVIFAEFKESIRQIKELLTKKKIKFITLDGEQKDKNIWKKFQEDDTIQVIICQYGSANAGIDLYKSSHTIYFEPNLSTTVISQSKDRTHRIGVKNACSYYWLVTKDTLEDDIYRKLVKKEDFNKEALQEIIEKYKKKI